MKKLSKILVTALLSASMCVSGFLAVNTLKANTVADALPITMSQYANAIKTTGAGASATYVENEKQLNVDSTFTGIKLNMVTGATYNLGTFDIASSNWAGGINATAASTEGNVNESLFEYVASPSAIDFNSYGSQSVLFNFTFTQGDKTMTIYAQNYRETGKNDVGNNDYGFAAQANGQSKIGCYRRTNGWRIWPSTISRKGRITTSDLANMGLTATSEAKINMIGYANATSSFYYDFTDNALYSPITLGVGTLVDSYLIRDFDSTVAAENGSDTAWAGFTKDGDKCLVNVTLTVESAVGFTGGLIITKIGNTVFNANVEANVKAVESSNALVNDVLDVSSFLYNDYFGSDISISVPQDYVNSLTIKVGADETSATLLEGTTEYTFTETANVYFYEGETLIGTTAVVVTDEIVSKVNVTSGKAFYQRGTDAKVELVTGAIVKVGDVITFEGATHEVTGDAIEDIRALNISGNEISTLTGNTATAISDYSYTVSDSDIRGKSSLDITAVLDNYCDVTVVDEYDGTTVLYGWQSVAGSVILPYMSIFNGDYRFYGASDGEKVFIGYGRDDGYTLKDNGEIDDWGYITDSEKGALYRVNASSNQKLNMDSNDSGEVLNKYECITKGMHFTALYVGVEVYTAINSTTGELNIIADYNQEDCMRWEKYVNVGITPNKHAQISIRYSIVDSNTGALISGASYTENKTAYMITGANVQKIGGLCRVTLPVIENLQEGQYIAYGAIITLASVQGGTTCNASKTYYLSFADYNEKAIASQIIANDKIYSTEAGKGYNFAVNVGGVNKYSKYTLTDLKKLYEIAENTTELTAWVEQTA